MIPAEEYLYLPDDLPDRDRLIQSLITAGGKLIPISDIVANLESHYQGILNNIPVAILQEDFSPVMEMLEGLRLKGITDLQAYSLENPDFVEKGLSAIRLISATQPTLAFFNARDSVELTFKLGDAGLHSSQILLQEMNAIWNHQMSVSLENVKLDLASKTVPVSIQWMVLPGYETDYSRTMTVIQASELISEWNTLRFSEERFHVIADISADFAFSLVDPQGDSPLLEWVSESFSQITGYILAEIQSQSSWLIFIHPDDQDLLSSTIKKALPGKVSACDVRLMTKAGMARWVHVAIKTITPSDEKDSCRVIGVFQDITAHKQAEIALIETKKQLQDQIQQLEKRTLEISLLSDMANNLQLCRTAEEAYAIAGETAGGLFPTFSGAFFIQQAGKKNLELTSFWGSPPLHARMEMNDCWAIRRGAPFLVQDEPRNLVCNHSRPISDFSSSLCIPILQQGEIFGLFQLEALDTSTRIDESTQHLAAALAEQIGLALTNVRLRENLSDQALHDPLTGLYNRYYMEEYLEKELHRSRRSGKPVSIIMIDMDHFRDLNTLFGHPNVDQALSDVGHFLLHAIRAGDVACRYGGDEFLLILPEASLEIARERAEQLCLGVHNVHVRSEIRPPQPISFSVGVASFPMHGQSVTELLRAADAAVFSAKDRGRDRVEVASI